MIYGEILQQAKKLKLIYRDSGTVDFPMGIEKDSSKNTLKFNYLSLVIPALLAIILFLAPLFPDVRLSRPKLLVLELGLYGTVFLWFAIGFLQAKLSLRKLIIFLPVLFYVAFEIFSYVTSTDRPIALNELKRSLISFIAYFAGANIIASNNQRSMVFTGLFAGSFLSIIYGILQHFGGFWRIAVPQMGRVMSTFGNPIFFAAYLVIILPIAVGLFFTHHKLWVRILLAVFLACGITALFFTQTRAAYIGFAFSMLVFSFLAIKQNRTRISILIVILIIFGIFLSLTKHIWMRQQEHVLIWRDSLVMWLKYPLLGTGPGTFHLYFPKFASEELKKIWPQDRFIVNDAHNEYVQYLAETGIAGFGILVWILVSFFRNAYSISRNRKGPERYILFGLISSSSGILVQNFFSVDMRFIISAIYLFLMMGFVNSFVEERIEISGISPSMRYLGFAGLSVLGFFVFPKILQPYIAQHKTANTPDFFDQKILEPAKTIAELETISQKYPNQSSVFEKLGWIYAKEKNWQKAIRNYEIAQQLNPGNAGPLNNLGNIYFLLGNRQKAIEYWNRSLMITPNQIDSRLNLATAYYYQGQLKESSDQIKEVLKINPNNEKAIVMLKQMTE